MRSAQITGLALLRNYKNCIMEESEILTAIKVAVEAARYGSLKEKQIEVIVNLVKGNDVFAVLPTGYGKSSCYICLPKVYDCLLKTQSSIVIV